MSVVASFELFSFQPEKILKKTHDVDQNTCNKLKHKKTLYNWISWNTFLPVGWYFYSNKASIPPLIALPTPPKSERGSVSKQLSNTYC